ncbi:LOW QUALITY PROTEIN: ubiquitin carboxyl-terminal hydrolase 1 [Plectropomus leopardus]|uniref:LOW QUALITY PROTEIN: ubiquitin carboxyl-terminal hydrolase 1 n=1 Tax=Plectropomus leopardus TaxID=160734 RepID=UPI001C4D88A6|nr:LOW QUALITY PROTEIN: ubiquitin carboxyl-terminal hydrolase 1 [Plectropomus leopardus]
MPGLQGETVVAAMGSPIKKSKLSLKFLQKKETKRVLDFSEPQTDEPKTVEQVESEASSSSCDQVVPAPPPCPASPGLLLPPEKRETLVPFVGLNNLGNTCYLNSILQVLYYCPGLREGIKKLYNLSKRKEKPKEETDKGEEQSEVAAEDLPTQIELLGSFNSLITSVEQLQSSFLLNPDSFSEGELATPPRKILHTLRQLNPMYEGYLQHDAQEVLQCILGYIQEACDTMRKEQELEREGDDKTEVKLENGVHLGSSSSATESKTPTEDDSQVSGKRKSDTEVGNAKKKPKSVTSKKTDAEVNRPLTRSKRKSSSDITMDSTGDKGGEEAEDEGMKKSNREEEKGSDSEGKSEKASKEADGKRKKRSKLSWLRPSGKQPSIFSKFLSVGKISSARNQNKPEQENERTDDQSPKKKTSEERSENMSEDKRAVKLQDGLDLMEHLFQGRLVLRTRCLECESFTERREDFQDISVPVLDDEPSSPDDFSEVSPDPKPELKTLKWAIAQFASVERIAGEDKYFCETCHHYTEAERSLLFDKTPEVITIHLKRFSANSLDLDPYAGLSKVNTPLQTPLTLSLDEWCTRPSSTKGQHYQLFAVVMHSGVTISSGHYTAYVRMSDLKDVKLWHGERKESEEDEKESKEGPQVKDEVLDYDDGEVSFSLNARGQRGASLASSKTGGKKLSEGVVGLLGGQRSLSSCDIGSSSKHVEKAASSGSTEGFKWRIPISSLGQNTEPGLNKEATVGEEASMASCGQQALNNLLEYEGKWLLFDDSEVRLFEEEDFLRACSPETYSSSTPYLLFYRRMPGPEH